MADVSGGTCKIVGEEKEGRGSSKICTLYTDRRTIIISYIFLLVKIVAKKSEGGIRH